MKDYSALSDQEINLAVAEKLGYTYLGVDPRPCYAELHYLAEKDGEEVRIPKFTTDISAAWEIITEYKISMVYDFNGCQSWTAGATFVHNYMYGADPYFDIEVDNPSPLRAAMEVFLMLDKEV